MGDRCYLRIEVRARDAQRVIDSIGEPSETDYDDEAAETDDSKPPVYLAYEEANYGGDDEIGELLALKIPFIGCHSEGCGYGAAVFAYDGITYREVSACDGDPVVEFSLLTGKPPSSAAKRIASFAKLYRKAYMLVYGKPYDEGSSVA